MSNGSTKDDNSHLASCLRDLADLPVPDLFKVVVRKWFRKLCWKLSFAPSLSGQQRWRPSARGCPSCTAPDQPGYRVGSELSFYNFICFLLFNLNEEDEDDAEPPEFHCSENCAKDVALHSFYCHVDIFLKVALRSCCLFVHCCFYQFCLAAFVESYQSDWDEIPEDVLNGVTWSKLFLRNWQSQIWLIWINLKAEFIRVQLTDVFSRSSRIVPDPLQHKLRVAWNLFCSLINSLKWTKQRLPGQQWTRTKNSVL